MITHNAMQFEIPHFGNYYNQQGATLDDYITDTIAPMLYYKFNEASGNLIDYGSEGADGTVTGATQGQTGQLGEGEAYLFDGVDDIITIANANIANVKALTTQRWAFLVNAASAGENSAGVFLAYANAGTTNHRLQFSASRLYGSIACATTSAEAISATGSTTPLLNDWVWFFMDYDHATSRKIRLWHGESGTLTQFTLGTDTASVGAITVQTADAHIGNRLNTALTFDGLFDVAIIDSGLWTTDEMQQLIDLAGV